MHLALFLTVVVTLLASDGVSWPGVSQPGARVVFAAGGVAVLVGLAVAASLGTVEALRRDFSQRLQSLRALDRWRRLVACLWVCVVAGIQFGLQWPGLVRGNWRLCDVVLLDELFILLPVVLPPVLVWAVEFEIDCALRVQGRRETWTPQLRARGQFVWHQVRLCLGWTLIPVLAVLTTRDLVQYWAPEVLASRHAPWVFAGPVLTIVLVFPGVLRPVWLTHRLADGSLRRRLESCAARSGVRVRDILVWRTGGRVVNAALVGTIPSLRYVLVTDGLLGLLDEDELEAVFAHEAGHARLHHVGQRMLAVLLPVGLWHLAQCGPAAAPAAWPNHLPEWGSVAPSVLLVALAAAYLVATVGWFSRLLEHQADLWACGYLSSAIPDSPTRADAARCYVRALEKVLLATCGNRRRTGWLHPNLKSRVDFVHQAAGDSARAELLDRRVRLARLLLLAGAALPPIVLLLLAGHI